MNASDFFEKRHRSTIFKNNYTPFMHGVSLKKTHSIFILILLILLNKNPKALFTTSQPEPKKAHFEMALEGFFVRLPL